MIIEILRCLNVTHVWLLYSYISTYIMISYNTYIISCKLLVHWDSSCKQWSINNMSTTGS